MAPEHPSPSAIIAPGRARSRERDARGGRQVGPAASLKPQTRAWKILPRQRVGHSLPLGFALTAHTRCFRPKCYMLQAPVQSLIGISSRRACDDVSRTTTRSSYAIGATSPPHIYQFWVGAW